MTERYRLTSDDDGHWYVVPASQQEAFEAYVDSEGEAEFPVGAHPVPGWPGLVTFTDPQIEV